MRKNRKSESNWHANAVFHFAFWLFLAAFVTGCDTVSMGTGGLGGLVEPTQATTANPESYALIGQRELQVTADQGVIANDAGATSVAAATTGTTYGGELKLNDDGSFSYTAPGGFFGTDSFQYTVDVDGGTMTGTASIKVYPADATPVP